MTLMKRSWQLFAGAVLLWSTLPTWGFGAEAGASLENDTSRWGSDYKRFAIASGGAETCAAACAADRQCRAWSYIKPTADNASALCRLKSAVPKAAADPCCTSGVAATAVGSTEGESRQVAAAASKPAQPASGVTGSIKKTDKTKTKPQGITSAAKPAGEVLQLPMEAETPEALTAVGASIDMPQPTLDN